MAKLRSRGFLPTSPRVYTAADLAEWQEIAQAKLAAREAADAGGVPCWEHGYRCHGFWLRGHRWGWVALAGPRRWTLAKRDGYGWGFSPLGGLVVEGQAKTLRQGKKLVEKLYREHVDAGPSRNEGQ